jgi:hypothetical protein
VVVVRRGQGRAGQIMTALFPMGRQIDRERHRSGNKKRQGETGKFPFQARPAPQRKLRQDYCPPFPSGRRCRCCYFARADRDLLYCPLSLPPLQYRDRKRMRCERDRVSDWARRVECRWRERIAVASPRRVRSIASSPHHL